MDIPREKAKTLAYNVKLPAEGKNIVCYFRNDSSNNRLNNQPHNQLNALQPGDEILFKAAIQPFRNKGNPDEFDYAQYMTNSGFSGTAYLPSNHWQTTGGTDKSVRTQALRCRKQILDFYQTLGFNDDEYAILAALTLGYKDTLSDDVKQSFRTTGTIHVLSVSGLHVGIIYAAISFLLGFVIKRQSKRQSRLTWLKPTLIILLLWLYAFVTGLSPSVVRASTMLTVLCASEIFGQKSRAVNGLYISAFFILLVNPTALFDVGFQLSFASVLSILYLHAPLSGMLKVENKYLRYVWQMFTLSVVAQLGVFPLCLYYFGTFPTYFFAANLVVVPLVSLIIYTFGGVILAKLTAIVLPTLGDYILYLSTEILHLLMKVMISTIHFFERLPCALIDNAKISAIDLILIILLLISLIVFCIHKKNKLLIVSLGAALALFGVHIYGNTHPDANTLTVYNRTGTTDVAWNLGHEQFRRTEVDIEHYENLLLGDKRLLIVAKDTWKGKASDTPFAVDYLLLTTDNSLSLYSLTQHLLPRIVVLDGSLSTKTARRLKYECEKLKIECYDVAEKGAFRIFF